jgi:methyl-accepting chemotaxis protein
MVSLPTIRIRDQSNAEETMKSLKKMTIAIKLGLGFGAILVLMIGLSVFALNRLSVVNGSTVDIATNWMPGVVVLGELKFDISAIRRDSLNFIVSTENQEHYQEKIQGEIESVALAEKRYEALISSEKERQIYQNFREQWEKYSAVSVHVRELAKEKKVPEAIALSQSEGSRTFEAAMKTLQEAIDLNTQGAAEVSNRAGIAFSAARYWGMGLLLGGVLVGVGVSIAVSRSISLSANRMLRMIETIAAKDLTVEDMQITSGDEVGKAGIALNAMKNNLHSMIQSIGETAEHVAAASEELSATSQQITANSEETTSQAKVVSEAGGQVNTNLQTLASGAEEMNSTIGEIAKNATEAARVSGEAVAAAESANRTVSKLGDSSAEIAKVIEVITSIAQQTNLLALNATIEAARAGEAGKGFAVVANEVKELAKQTAKATEEIKHKIGVIQENTTGAVTAIVGIKGVIDKISHISTVIATAVEEQSATTSEMSRNVGEAARGASTISDNIQGVASAAQNTSTSVGEAQTATEHLSRMAGQLHDLVGQFKVSSKKANSGSEVSLLKTARAAAGR